MPFRLLFVGDVVGESGCAAVQALVPALRQELELDAVIINAENSASSGRGISPDSGLTLLSVADFLTLGNHAFDIEGVEEFLDQEPRVEVCYGKQSQARVWGYAPAARCRV